MNKTEIVKVQVARGQYRVTIPKSIAKKANLSKGQHLFIAFDGEKILLEAVEKKK